MHLSIISFEKKTFWAKLSDEIVRKNVRDRIRFDKPNIPEIRVLIQMYFYNIITCFPRSSYLSEYYNIFMNERKIENKCYLQTCYPFIYLFIFLRIIYEIK